MAFACIIGRDRYRGQVYIVMKTEFVTWTG